MLAFSTPKPSKRLTSALGFTLLEVLTVLFILGLVTAFVVPNFPVLMDRIMNANQRDTIVRTINTLPYNAYSENQDFVLLSIDGNQQNRSKGIDDTDVYAGTSFRTHNIQLARLSLPEGWTLRVDSPIFYRMSGFCGGGTIELNTGLSVTSYELAPPLCQLEEN